MVAAVKEENNGGKKKSMRVRYTEIKNPKSIFYPVRKGEYEATHALYEDRKLLFNKGIKFDEDRYLKLSRRMKEHPKKTYEAGENFEEDFEPDFDDD